MCQWSVLPCYKYPTFPYAKQTHFEILVINQKVIYVVALLIHN